MESSQSNKQKQHVGALPEYTKQKSKKKVKKGSSSNSKSSKSNNSNGNNSQILSSSNKKAIIKNFLNEGQRIGQIFKQTEFEYKTFLIEGQKIPGFDRAQFAYWNGYLMSTQNLYSIFEFEGNLKEYDSYIKELRDWENEFFQIYEDSKNQQKKAQLINKSKMGQSKTSPYKRLSNLYDENQLSMILELSMRHEMDQSQQNFSLIRKSIENSQEITMQRIMEKCTEEDDEEYEEDTIIMEEGNGGGSQSNIICDNQDGFHNYTQSGNQLGTGLVLPESQKIQLHPNIKCQQQHTNNGNDKPNGKKGVCTIF